MQKKEKIYTLMFIVQEVQILLGMKKRGFGHGKYNGFGGKVELNETIMDAAIRETNEECGIVPINPILMGQISCEYECEPTIFKVYIFKAQAFTGKVTESEEMRPQWFKVDEIPYNQMWADDPYWMPLLLDNKHFIGKLDFETHEKLVKANVNQVSQELIMTLYNNDSHQGGQIN